MNAIRCHEGTCRRTAGYLVTLCALGVLTTAASAGTVTLANRGEARCVIVVPPGSMTWDGSTKALNNWSPPSEEPERRRRLARDSVLDLAHYLGRMCGARIEIVEGLPAREQRTPIYVGAEAQRVFGPVGTTKAGLFGFRVVAGRKGVGLYGESEYGTSYAIYEFLHRLGCRWYMPSDLGECIPSLSTLRLPEMDESLSPATEWRRMENRTADPDFRRRNRMGGSADGGGVMWQGGQGTLEGLITREQRAEHPEWCLLVDGKPHPAILRWSRQDVADAIGDAIIGRLETEFAPVLASGLRVGFSLEPGDFVLPTGDPEERKADPDPRVWEPAANQWSVTDRLVLINSRVAERVAKRYPDVLFHFLAYVNHSMPPVKYRLHPNVIPVIAPIDFNRHHPMTWPNHPNQTWLLDMVEGWGKAASRIGYYAYGMNLAELSAPNPFITKWGTDIPIIMQSKCAFWMPETMGGWESMMPGFYLSTRLTFYPDEKPEAILAEMWTRFYGAAAEPIGRYWNRMDRAWTNANEYSGCLFGYLRIFTPEVMKGARADVDDALARCQTIPEYRRVELINESLRAFEMFMKMRQDWAAGRLGTLAADYETWTGAIRSMASRYARQYVIGGLTLDYTNAFCGAAYKDGSRMEREFVRLGAPMLDWKWKQNPGPEADSLPWAAPDYDDKEWPTTQVVRETWSSIGHHNTMTSGERSGRMAYRAKVDLAALPAGKKAFLWIGSTDGSAKLFVNGQHVKYVVSEKTRWNERGDVVDAFSGYCRPAQFDVTGTAKPGANQITILCERAWLNELGTGGLMGPVVVYREK